MRGRHAPAAAPSGAGARFRCKEPALAEIELRPFATALPRVLLIGSSTGGPQAVTALVGRLGGMLTQAPVLITQHMPPTFTTIFAEHLARASGRPAREAEDGEPINAGRIYVAPGGRHMRVDAPQRNRRDRASTMARRSISASRP